MAYAIILDEYLREGMTLQAALARLSEWAAGIARRKEEREEEMVAAQNRAALEQIEALMGIPKGRGLA
jgi:hypothetical protein